MKIAIYCLLATLLLLLILAGLMKRLHYRIGSRYLKITVFGITLRRIRLADICYANKREPKGLAEYWYNTFQSSHRVLTIERTRGLRKYICITPRNRYVFLSDLKSAVRRVNPECEWANKTDEQLAWASPELGTAPESLREGPASSNQG